MSSTKGGRVWGGRAGSGWRTGLRVRGHKPWGPLSDLGRHPGPRIWPRGCTDLAWPQRLGLDSITGGHHPVLLLCRARGRQEGMFLWVTDCPRGSGGLHLLPVVLPVQRPPRVKVKVPPTRGLAPSLLQLILDKSEVFFVICWTKQGSLDPVGPHGSWGRTLIVWAALGCSSDVRMKTEHPLAARGERLMLIPSPCNDIEVEFPNPGRQKYGQFKVKLKRSMFCQSVLISRCQSNLKRFLPLSSYQLHTLEEDNLTITSGFPEQNSNCLRNLFVVQLRRLRWFKHNESCAKPNLTSICPVDMGAKPESPVSTWLPLSACSRTTVTPWPALPGPGLSSQAPFFSLGQPAQCNTQHSLYNAALWHSQSSWRRIILHPSPIGSQSPWTAYDWLGDYNIITHVNRAL